VAIVGPGLDFSDKLDGYDFYPPQTIQPFAVVDSLTRLGLASRSGVQVTAFDLSARILQHVQAARMRARNGQSYPLVLPRNLDQSWSAPLVSYWQRAGDRIGARAPSPAPPANAGRAQVRRILVRPATVLSITTQDLNIVVQHPDPLPPGEQFDLMIATNILLYYDVFEQSLAGINIAKMLRPGGLLLTNNRIFELPSTPLSGIDFTDVNYISIPGHLVSEDCQLGSTADYQLPTTNGYNPAHARILDCPRESERPGRVQEIHGPPPRHLQELQRAHPRAWRTLPGHGRRRGRRTPRRHRIS
jgi:hypothetical protein